MTVTVRIPTTLRPLSGGVSTVQVEGSTLGEILNALNVLPIQVSRIVCLTVTAIFTNL